MDEFEIMCGVIEAYSLSTEPMTLDYIDSAPLEGVLLETSRRLVRDPFFVALGRRLFEDYAVVRWVSRSLFSWLFQGQTRPYYLSE